MPRKEKKPATSVIVVSAAARKARLTTAADRWWLRGSLGLLALLTLVVVASALHRMDLYQDAYGFTRLRLLVDLFEGWLGLVVVAVLVAGIGLRGDVVVAEQEEAVVSLDEPEDLVDRRTETDVRRNPLNPAGLVEEPHNRIFSSRPGELSEARQCDLSNLQTRITSCATKTGRTLHA